MYVLFFFCYCCYCFCILFFCFCVDYTLISLWIFVNCSYWREMSKGITFVPSKLMRREWIIFFSFFPSSTSSILGSLLQSSTHIFIWFDFCCMFHVKQIVWFLDFWIFGVCSLLTFSTYFDCLVRVSSYRCYEFFVDWKWWGKNYFCFRFQKNWLKLNVT